MTGLDIPPDEFIRLAVGLADRDCKVGDLCSLDELEQAYARDKFNGMWALLLVRIKERENEH